MYKTTTDTHVKIRRHVERSTSQTAKIMKDDYYLRDWQSTN